MAISLNCIDCQTRKIVQVNLEDEYIALSYVWGAPKSDEHPLGRSTRALSSSVSKVVEDALVVVCALGKRYLWVDKYCVEQQEHDIKTIQIQNMDQTYAGAYATIIACAGSDANSGLPGVTTVMRTQQPSADTQNLRLVSSLSPLPCALKNTAWITRGWTYQEAILSKRCLFFTEQQVYFVCRCMSRCEAVVNGSNDRIKRSRSLTTTLSAEIFGLERTEEDLHPSSVSPELRELADHIRAYTTRNLTYEDDALDAFRGVLRRSHFPTYYGIPIAPNDISEIGENAKDFNIGFARGLYWLPLRTGGGGRIPLSRRSKFPSWSWVGWKGSVEYCRKNGPPHGIGEGGFMEVERESFDTAFLVEDADHKLHSLKDLYRSTLSTRMIPELSNYLAIEAWVVRFRFKPALYGKLEALSTHDRPLPAKKYYWHAVMCQEMTQEMYHRLCTEVWDCILLFKAVGSNEDLYNLMIVEWVGNVAQRIGAITVPDSDGTFRYQLKKRQRVRMI